MMWSEKRVPDSDSRASVSKPLSEAMLQKAELSNGVLSLVSSLCLAKKSVSWPSARLGLRLDLRRDADSAEIKERAEETESDFCPELLDILELISEEKEGYGRRARGGLANI